MNCWIDILIHVLLKRVISVIILAKIRGFWLCWDALARIVSKFPAFSVTGTHTFFAAQHLLIIDLGGIFTVGARALDLLSKQHGTTSFYKVLLYYISFAYEML